MGLAVDRRNSDGSDGSGDATGQRILLRRVAPRVRGSAAGGSSQEGCGVWSRRTSPSAPNGLQLPGGGGYPQRRLALGASRERRPRRTPTACRGAGRPRQGRCPCRRCTVGYLPPPSGKRRPPWRGARPPSRGALARGPPRSCGRPRRTRSAPLRSLWSNTRTQQIRILIAPRDRLSDQIRSQTGGTQPSQLQILARDRLSRQIQILISPRDRLSHLILPSDR